MHHLSALWRIALTLGLIALPCFANESVQRARQMQAEARQAAKQGDMPQAETLLRQAQSLRPMHPGLLLELAGALTANGKTEEAAQTLRLAAQMGLVFRLSDNPAFAPLTTQPAYIEAVKQLQQNQQPVGKARVISSRLPAGLIPEGIAHDAARNKTYISSVAQGTIYNIAQAAPFSADTGYGAFGLKIDAKRNALWLAGAQLAEHRPSRQANNASGAAITRINRHSGNIEAQYKLAEDSSPHLLGDIALAADGSVYATDSKAPAIYRLDEKRAALVPWLRSPEFSSLQGMVFSADDKTAYVADYAVGIARIDRQTQALQWLPVPPGTTLLGIDGLYRRGCELIATQNGMNPHRVLRLSLAPDGQSISQVQVVAANLASLSDLTHATLINDNTLRIIAKSDWNAVGADGSLPDSREPPILLDIALPPIACRR